MSKTFYLMAHMELKESEADAFEATFQKHARDSRAKVGNLFFYLVREIDDRTKYSTMEAWENKDYFEQHVADAEHEEFQAKLQPVLAKEVDARFYDLIQGMD